MQKTKVGIIGTGNIGIDLMLKIRRSKVLECSIFAGRNPESRGIQLAQEAGIPVTFDSIKYIEDNPSCCDIVFDATSAKVHEYNAPILKRLGKFTIDLTPAHVGGFCVPVVNLETALDQQNVNLITCGGQATIPIAYAITRIHPDTKYIEIAATIASRSAGPGTRNNIDEFTQTTREALMEFTGVQNAKAIIVLNPAEPPITMRNTVYALCDNPDMPALTRAIFDMEKKIQKYVPGYKVVVGPLNENGRITTTIEVVGSGDYLPKYSGNLDIITCAAIEIAENYAKRRLERVEHG